MITIEAKLKEILRQIVEFVDTDDIKLDSELKDYGLDSIAFVQLVVAIENEFVVEFDDEDLDVNKFPLFQNLIDYVNLKLG